jgi:hypothetical protein
MHTFYQTGIERYADGRLQDSNPEVWQSFPEVGYPSEPELDLPINLCSRDVENKLGFISTTCIIGWQCFSLELDIGSTLVYGNGTVRLRKIFMDPASWGQ